MTPPSSNRDSLELLRLAAAPQLTDRGRAARLNDRSPDPQAGQLWRARWNETTLLVVVLTAKPGAVTACPVQVAGLSDDDGPHNGEVALSAPSFRSRLLGYPGLGKRLPAYVLDVLIDELPQPALITLQAAASEAWTTASAGEADEGLGEIDDALAFLASATWVPSERLSASSVLRSIPPSRLSALLGCSLSEAADVKQDRRSLSVEQAQSLASATGLGAPDLLRVGPDLPEGLVRDIASPRWRPEWSQPGRADAESLFALAQDSFALAARDDRRDINWTARIEAAIAQRKKGPRGA